MHSGSQGCLGRWHLGLGLKGNVRWFQGGKMPRCRLLYDRPGFHHFKAHPCLLHLPKTKPKAKSALSMQEGTKGKCTPSSSFH